MLKIPMDDVVARYGIDMVPRYRCCTQPQQETIFISGNFGRSIWLHFSNAAGIQGPFVHVKQAISKWWNYECVPKFKPIYQAATAIILWQIWK